jgi:dipeptidyl-peptidase-4
VGDDNVHVQNLDANDGGLDSNKQFDSQFIQIKNHGIYGGMTRIHCTTKMTNFIKENL